MWNLRCARVEIMAPYFYLAREIMKFFNWSTIKIIFVVFELIYAVIEAITESFPQTIIQFHALLTIPDINRWICIASISIAAFAITKHALFFYFNIESLSLARQHFGHDDAVQYHLQQRSQLFTTAPYIHFWSNLNNSLFSSNQKCLSTAKIARDESGKFEVKQRFFWKFLKWSLMFTDM